MTGNVDMVVSLWLTDWLMCICSASACSFRLLTRSLGSYHRFLFRLYISFFIFVCCWTVPFNAFWSVSFAKQSFDFTEFFDSTIFVKHFLRCQLCGLFVRVSFRHLLEFCFSFFFFNLWLFISWNFSCVRVVYDLYPCHLLISLKPINFSFVHILILKMNI